MTDGPADGKNDLMIDLNFVPVWARKDHAGFALGSAGAFIVIESKQHALARGAAR